MSRSEMSATREENDNVHSFASPSTKSRGKQRRERITSMASLLQQEEKRKKKAAIANSEHWKLKHRKEQRRFRDQKYTEPIDDPIDFSQEEFNNELSSKESQKVFVLHTFTDDDGVHAVVRFRGTFYKGSHKKNDGILIAHEAYHTDGLVPIRWIHRGLSTMLMAFHVMDRIEYGSGYYKLIVE